MKNQKVIVALLFVPLALAVPLIVLHRNQDTSELRFVAESQPCTAANCFESVSHYRYLYEGDTQISRVYSESLSPSGNYTAFEDDGKIMLYIRGSGNLKEITDGQFAVPESFIWDEPQSQLTITYYNDNSNPQFNNHAKSIVQLN